MEDGAYRFGEFSLFPSERRLCQNATTVLLPPKAFDAMYLLVRNHGGLVLRQEIIQTLWPDIHVTEANLTNIIVLLRNCPRPRRNSDGLKIRISIYSACLGEPG